MSTMCKCHHGKSQHHIKKHDGNSKCDYYGYACKCIEYRRIKDDELFDSPIHMIDGSLKMCGLCNKAVLNCSCDN